MKYIVLKKLFVFDKKVLSCRLLKAVIITVLQYYLTNIRSVVLFNKIYLIYLIKHDSSITKQHRRASNKQRDALIDTFETHQGYRARLYRETRRVTTMLLVYMT